MYPLFESIALIDGVVQHPFWHHKRFLKSYCELYGTEPNYSLLDNFNLSKEYTKGTYKLRVSYNKEEIKTEIQEYKLKPITSLQMVDGNHLDYSIKLQDRSELDKLYEQRKECDDILIIKNQLVTDSSYANIVFSNGTSWHTPHIPLLPGTARARLIEAGKIEEMSIGVNDLKRYKSFKLINALRDFDQIEEGSVNDIILL